MAAKDILEPYEKDMLDRARLTLRDIMWYEPEDLAAELKHRITLERAREIRGLLQLTSLKGVTIATARPLFDGGIQDRWSMLNMTADQILERVNAKAAKPWGDKEHKKITKILADNEELLDDL